MAQRLSAESGNAADTENLLVIPKRQSRNIARYGAMPADLSVDGPRVEAGGLKVRRDGIRHCDSACEQSEADERGEQPHDRPGNASGMAPRRPPAWNATRLTGKAWLTGKAVI